MDMVKEYKDLLRDLDHNKKVLAHFRTTINEALQDFTCFVRATDVLKTREDLSYEKQSSLIRNCMGDQKAQPKL